MDIIELYPFSAAGDADRVVAIHNVLRAEQLPWAGRATGPEYAAKNDDPAMRMRHFVIPDADGKGDVGILVVGIWTDGSNQTLAWAMFGVRPEVRRQGIGTTLLYQAALVAAEAGRSTIEFGVIDSVPAGSAFAESVGASVGLREHINVVDVADLDTDMLAAWVEAGPGRAPAYDVLLFEDGVPDRYFGDIARLFVIGDEDMPMGDLEYEPTAETAETVKRRFEQTADHVERVTVVAQHRPTGRLVAFSELVVVGTVTDTLQTTLTVVDRDHRGHALGKWIKGVAILRGIERYPEAVRLTTENAVTNAPMLGINDLVGFVPRYEMIDYQIKVEDVLVRMS